MRVKKKVGMNCSQRKSEGQISNQETAHTLDHELERARAAAERNYRSYPNVVGVAAGTKFVKRLATGSHYCIHFYVRQKPPKGRLRKAVLPRFVYGRFRNGKVNRKIKFPTDVIRVGAIRMACGSGSQIEALGSRGAITLLFQNKFRADKNFCLLTCAHVVGDLMRSPALNPELNSECCPNVSPFAVVV
jgi:hypothetical protein